MIFERDAACGLGGIDGGLFSKVPLMAGAVYGQ